MTRCLRHSLFIDMQCKVPVFIFTTQVCSDVPQCNLASATRNIFGFLLIWVIVYSDNFYYCLFFFFLWNPPSHPGPIHSFLYFVHTCPPPPWLHWIITHTLRSHSLDDQMRNAKRRVEWMVGSSLSKGQSGCKHCE